MRWRFGWPSLSDVADGTPAVRPQFGRRWRRRLRESVSSKNVDDQSIRITQRKAGDATDRSDIQNNPHRRVVILADANLLEQTGFHRPLLSNQT